MFRIVLLALMVVLSTALILITEDGIVRLINFGVCALSIGMLIAQILLLRRKRKTSDDGPSHPDTDQ